MARKKLSEFIAKKLLFNFLGKTYTGVPVAFKDGSFPQEDLRIMRKELREEVLYVVKVDEGVKKRMKQGLVFLKVTPKDVPQKIEELAKRGYSRFLIEEFAPHEPAQEKYLSIERTREGLVVYFSEKGGIDVEENQENVRRVVISELGIRNKGVGKKEIKEITTTVGLDEEVFTKLLEFFEEQYMSFLEINPFILHNSSLIILDLAVEVDSAAEFFVKEGWTTKDFVGQTGGKTEEEKNILELQAKSQASLKMEMLNPNGSIFVMLFGGGGSIVIADEIYNQGCSRELANYSDYSGGPKEAETVIYVENILRSLVKSGAKKKAFIIAGTFANFTDVSVTFRGVIKALENLKDDLKKQDLKIFVRRPGPNQKIGLALIKEYLEKENLFGGVWDSSMVISDVVLQAIKYLKD